MTKTCYAQAMKSLNEGPRDLSGWRGLGGLLAVLGLACSEPGEASDRADGPADIGPADLEPSRPDRGPGDGEASDSGPSDGGPSDGGLLDRCAADPASVLRVHYRNPELQPRYRQLHLWTWGAWTPEKDVPVCGVDDFGAIVDLPRDWFSPGLTMGYKFKQGAGTGGPWYEMDRAWTEGQDCWEVFVVKGDTTPYCSAADAARPQLRAVWWDSPTELNLEFSQELSGLDEPARYRLEPEVAITAATATPRTAKLTTGPLSIQVGYTLTFDSDQGPLAHTLFPRRVMDDFVTDLPLGALIDEAGDTTFRLWSPRATAVTLHLSASPTGEAEEVYPLVRDAAGVWSHTLAGNRDGTYYWYTVAGPTGAGEHFDPTRPLNDPYSLIALSSFGGVAGRSMVFDPARLGPVVELQRPPLEALVAWEVHVRDLTGAPNSGLAVDDPDRGRYLGFIRRGLTGPLGPDGLPVRTGLDHILELGVNAVQLLPVEEFPADPARFNWGYFTANFFSPEGMYASSDEGGAKALELKALVDALHAQGVAVILDVVFNHSAEGSELGPTFNFKGIDSKYWYRQDPFTFSYANGSGVGNELASERPMVRRFMLDCLRHWVERYGIDGFRFDLAALHDLKTIREIGEAFPDRYLYGEPWAASGAQWSKGAVNTLEPWAVFDDDYRNLLKGSPEGSDRGFIQGQRLPTKLRTAFTGSSVNIDGHAWAASPLDGIRYLDAHDNLTLADKLEVSLAGLTVAQQEARIRLAAAALLTSPGPVMLHAGVEFLRTKPYLPGGDGRPLQDADRSEAWFDANSYSSVDETNNLNWQQKADHLAVFRYWQGLLALRQSDLGQPARPSGSLTAAYFDWHLPAEPGSPALGYTLNADRSHGPRRLRVLLNPAADAEASFAIRFPIEEGWRLVASGEEVEIAGWKSEELFPEEASSVNLEPLGVRIYADGF